MSGSASSKKWLVVVGAIGIQLILGTVYGYSIFWEPLSAQIFPEIVVEADALTRIAEGAEPRSMTVVADADAQVRAQDVQSSYLKYAFSICILSFAFVMVIAGRVQDVKGPRFPAIVGAVLMGSGFVLAGLMRSESVFYLAHAAATGAVGLVLLMVSHALLGKLDPEENPIIKYVPNAILISVAVGGVLLGNRYVGNLGHVDRLFLLWGTVGFMAGAGIGFAYVCPIAALVKWFPEHKGLVSGVAVAGFGLGAYVFSRKWGALGYIQENDILPFFVTHGIICFVAVSIGAMFLSNPEGSGTKAASASSDSTWQDTLKNPAFYLLWLMFFSGAMAGLMVIGIIKPFAGSQLVSAAGVAITSEEGKALMGKGAAAVGWLAIFNAVGRVVWGLVSDKIGRTPAFMAMFSLQAVMMFLLAGMQTELSLAIAASLIGFNFGGNFALFPSATADLFGAKNLGANYGWVFTAYGIAGVVGVAAGNAAKVRTGSYSAAFLMAAVLCIIAAFCALIVRRYSAAKTA